MGGLMLVMCDDDNEKSIIGTSWITFDGRRLHLHHFGIDPECQGRGLAKELLRESLRFVKETGYQVKLEVHRSNIAAIELYRKAGFEYLGDYDVYIIRDVQSIEI
jgi:ribosomal-protein-alanine N-acetyltransferase